MKPTGITRQLACAYSALRELLALFGLAAILGVMLLAVRGPVEKALPSLMLDPVTVSSKPTPGPIQVSAAETAREREQQVLAEFIAKRNRVADEAAAQYVAIAYLAGAEHSVDPLLILAVMAVESRYNPVAESFMGAKGLMQVIAKYHQEKLLHHGGEQALLVPEVNIQVGAQILREYQRRFGDTETALQVYGGAFDDPTSRYATKVFAEKAHLDALSLKARKQQIARAF
jgi:soluble lytic murein transglycosylase-like protein